MTLVVLNELTTQEKEGGKQVLQRKTLARKLATSLDLLEYGDGR
jgi:hypothetical protein